MIWSIISQIDDLSGVRLPTLQLITSYSQRLNSGKLLGTGCCE